MCSYSVLKERMITIYLVLGTVNGQGFIHQLIRAYTPWNPGGNKGGFWSKITDITNDASYLWTLAGDVNATVASMEHTGGGLDAK